MSDNRHRTAKWSVVQRAALAPSAVLALSLILIWALTGAGYFWPMWAMLGIAIPTGIWFSLRWARMQREPTSRRYAAHAGVSAVLALAGVAIWVMSGRGYFWPVWPMLGLAGLLALHRAILRPGQRSLEVRVDELTRTRSGALNEQASQLRRIERDLHDGAQARLVALSMQLGRAEERLADRPETAALIRRAREEATAAIAELRDLARGIAPPVLADRGLKAAVESLANRSAASVEVRGDLDHRPPPVVETAAYFVVAESLTNVVKHAPGATARVTVTQDGAMLVVEVVDNGPGGADPAGSGLTGLKQRVEALDGRLEVHSVPGDGTVVWAVLPCE
ncbi:MAG TPA: histidine kinase [Solirubrobacteraceae bacterium]|jgi:signal transduction histidine kinase|nr:histidine kinase [Solirubrobacteraceae bacterium]